MTKTIEDATTGAPALRTLRAQYDDGHRIGDHHHAWGQLVYAAAGAIHLTTPSRSWLIPPARAVWLPPRAEHALRMRGHTRLRTIYVPQARCAGLGAEAAGLAVTPLLRELILALSGFVFVNPADPVQAALGGALLALLADARPITLVLAQPLSPVAARVAQAIEADPTRDVALPKLAAEHGTTLRTLQRRFLAETGMPLSAWRQGARLMNAAAMLLQGESVTRAALDAGYASTSAFITAFRTRFGETPGAFRAAAARKGPS